MQPTKGRLCAFWLGALVSAAKSAPDVETAAIPIAVLTYFLWNYTSACVPKALLQPLSDAVAHVATLPARQGVDDFPFSEGHAHCDCKVGSPPWTCPHRAANLQELLQWLWATDCVTRGHRIPDGSKSSELSRQGVVMLASIMSRSLPDICAMTAHSAKAQDAKLGFWVGMRGAGLLSSAYAFIGAQKAADFLLSQWLKDDIVALEERALAVTTAAVGSGTFSGGFVNERADVRRPPAKRNERYAPAKGQLGTVRRLACDDALPTLQSVAQKMRRARATHLPLLWHTVMTHEHVRKHDHDIAAYEDRAPSGAKFKPAPYEQFTHCRGDDLLDARREPNGWHELRSCQMHHCDYLLRSGALGRPAAEVHEKLSIFTRPDGDSGALMRSIPLEKLC